MKKAQLQGILRLHRDGYGFVEPMNVDKDQDDIFIPARYVGGALHTDLVEVELQTYKGKQEGKIVAVVERRVHQLIARLEKVGKSYRAISSDERVQHQILIAHEKVNGAHHGENVIVRITRYPDEKQTMEGEVVEVLGERGGLATELLAVIVRHQLPREFPQKVTHEAEEKKMLPRHLEGREDLRHLPFVTIDGETAKDFDDAVTAEWINDNIIRLWVSIADVSHFVLPGTDLDHEAYKRATSVYLPGTCLPMLPEKLSNDLCSLRANEDRLTMTARMDINEQGEVVDRAFSVSVIRSRRRMTYTDIKRIFLEKKKSARDAVGDLIDPLETMKACFERLRRKRLKRGSIDFDLPEPEIVLDLQGAIEEIVKAERHIGHMMIEEFMIAANEAVAEFLTEKRQGCIYRIHEAPEPRKLREFSILLHNLGYRFFLEKSVSPMSLAKIVEALRGKPEERMVNHQLLRSMAKAVYSHENRGHFGLASSCYCHFTSPIRRYPDVVIHRLLKKGLKFSEPKPTRIPDIILHETSVQASQRERVSMEAERESAKLYASFFMRERVGEEFEGVVSHITKFGFFVQLIAYFVEGLVPLQSLRGDHYVFDEKGMVLHGKRPENRFRIGDRIKIKIQTVDVVKREIVFSLLPT
ncbi:MAG: ribonuclease R [Deltaproteobacteria bacterium RIFCSPHIGHO2_02_FULL_44_16]|nr:MAG: ribonuclease R [Deltaproteobacteria bacterium RIFCSPHIGHO2_02_FULL_44_16]